jgi:signal transduction histidine kinase
MAEPQPSHDVDTRVERYTRESNLGWATAALMARRGEILARWLEVAAAQPFHQGSHDRAVADEIPKLLDALIAYLGRAIPETVDPIAPLDDPGIQRAAQGHALARVEQGLRPPDVLTEFRLLRQELLRALRLMVPDGAPTSDVVGAEILLNDALDGAMALALSALTGQIEQQREEFLADVLHEIRQPITKLLGFTQLAQRLVDRPEPDLARVRSSLGSVRQAGDELMALVRMLSDASRAALGGFALTPVSSDLASLLREIVHQQPPEVRRRIRLELPDGGTASGQVDVDRFTQVIDNLLSNAAKYSSEDSPITVTLATRESAATITVHDEGIGIPAEDLPRLFARYVRANNAVEQQIDGLGLGLYVSRGIVEAHGGRIWAVSSGEGQGTTISIVIPLER